MNKLLLIFIVTITIFISCGGNETPENKKTCKDLSCIEGTCVEKSNGAFCKCNDNASLTKHGICAINTCEEQGDCSVFKNKICSTDYKCIEKCETDKDCVGKNEICLKKENKCVDIGVYYTEHPCGENEYLNPVTRTCLATCKTNTDCGNGKICDGYKHCSKECSKNSDCPNNKFENLCDYRHNYCSKSYEDLPSRKEIIIELLNRFLPSLECKLPNKETFTTTCGDYTIETNGKNEWGVDTIKISKNHPNLIEFSLADYTDEDMRLFNKDFKNIVINSNFLEDILPVYNKNNILPLRFWKGHLAMSKEIKTDFIRDFMPIHWQGISIASHSFNFSFNKDKEVQLIEIPYIYYSDTSKNDTLIQELSELKDEINTCAKAIYPDSQVSTFYTFIKLEENQEFPEIYFMINVNQTDYYTQNKFLLKKTNYDSSCSSVQNAIDNNKILFDYFP